MRVYWAISALPAAIGLWTVVTGGSRKWALIEFGLTILCVASGAVERRARGQRRVGGGAPTVAHTRLLRVALATGFASTRSLVMRCLLAVAGCTLLQRFVLWPSAAPVFDIAIACAAFAILLLLSFFMVRASYT